MSNKKERKIKDFFQTCSLYIRYKNYDEVTEDNGINAPDVSGIARMWLREICLRVAGISAEATVLPN